eukprot:1799810-Pleurochrysis_carterae.AAC.4
MHVRGGGACVCGQGAQCVTTAAQRHAKTPLCALMPPTHASFVQVASSRQNEAGSYESMCHSLTQQRLESEPERWVRESALLPTRAVLQYPRAMRTH